MGEIWQQFCKMRKLIIIIFEYFSEEWKGGDVKMRKFGGIIGTIVVTVVIATVLSGYVVSAQHNTVQGVMMGNARGLMGLCCSNDIDVDEILEDAKNTLNESEVFELTDIRGREIGIIMCNSTAIGIICSGVELDDVDVGPLVVRQRFGDLVKVLLTKDEVVVGWIFVPSVPK